MSSLNVIALISGGKDSLYSLLHCVQNGHRIVALGNLHPALPPKTRSTELEGKFHLHQSYGEQQFASSDEGAEEDLNSFLYQTVGYNVVPLYGIALKLPLYRCEITGTAAQSGRSYDPYFLVSGSGTEQHNDETESLTDLLSYILQRHPEANAVSSGAILSNYQRVRIESVATRLNLVPLSYLWQYPVLPPPHATLRGGSNANRLDSQTGLLDDMALAHCDARIIKVSSGGLDEHLLGRNVADSRTRNRLARAMSPFFSNSNSSDLRGAILGEGGEYETLAVGGPKTVWKGGTIDFDMTKTMVETGEGGVMWLNIPEDAASIVPWEKDGGSYLLNSDPGQTGEEIKDALVPIPALYDPQFTSVTNTVRRKLRENLLIDNLSGDVPPKRILPNGESNSTSLICEPSVIFPATPQMSAMSPSPVYDNDNSYPFIQLSNITYLTSVPDLPLQIPSNHLLPSINVSDQQPSQPSGNVQLIELQSKSAIHALRSLLISLSLGPRNIMHTTLLLRNMSAFSTVNAIYSSLFPPGMPWPPSRVCVAVGDSLNVLGAGVDVAISVVVDARFCGDVGAGTGRHLNMREKLWSGLHVQSRSYWAPANIGPYSQAIRVAEMLESHILLDYGTLPGFAGVGPQRANRTLVLALGGHANDSVRVQEDANLVHRQPHQAVTLEEQELGETVFPETGPDLEVVYLAGQIPLMPSSMELYIPPAVTVSGSRTSPSKIASITDDSFTERAVLSLQHLWRVAQEQRMDVWAGAGIAYLPLPSHFGERAENESQKKQDADGHGEGIRPAEATREFPKARYKIREEVVVCQQVWQATNSYDREEEDLDGNDGDEDLEDEAAELASDIWHRQFNRPMQATSDLIITKQTTPGAHLHPLPDHHLMSEYVRFPQEGKGMGKQTPPLIVAEVSSLPRGADVEWSGLGLRVKRNEGLKLTIIRDWQESTIRSPPRDSAARTNVGEDNNSRLVVNWLHLSRCRQNQSAEDGRQAETWEEVEGGKTSTSNTVRTEQGHGTGPKGKGKEIIFLTLMFPYDPEPTNKDGQPGPATDHPSTFLSAIIHDILEPSTAPGVNNARPAAPPPSFASKPPPNHHVVHGTCYLPTHTPVDPSSLLSSLDLGPLTVIPCHRVWGTSVVSSSSSSSSNQPQRQNSDETHLEELTLAIELRVDIY